MLRNILPKFPSYPDIRGKWIVDYSRDIILSGYINENRIFVVYLGDHNLELRSTLHKIESDTKEEEHVTGVLYIDRQILSVAWGFFYWSPAKSNIKHIYDAKRDFIDTRHAKIELIPPKEVSDFHRKFLGKGGETSPEGDIRIIHDHIVGLFRVCNYPRQLWGSTTSLMGDRNECFACLPYFSAAPLRKSRAAQWSQFILLGGDGRSIGYRCSCLSSRHLVALLLFSLLLSLLLSLSIKTSGTESEERHRPFAVPDGLPGV